MKHIATNAHDGFFEPLLKTCRLQAAMMVLRKGESSSAKVDNEHPNSEQWILVLDGRGTAVVGEQSVQLEKGDLLVIETNEPHRISNRHIEPLVTINFYAPPAYTSEGNVLATAKSK